MPILMVFEQYPIIFYSVVVVVGLLVGSFLNVVIFRVPVIMEHEWSKECSEHLELDFKKKAPPGIAISRSHCPQCKKQLSALHNIPLFSYVFLKGKCAFCKAKISFRYPFIELLSALLSLLIAVKFGVSLMTVAAIVLTWFLIVIAFIDIDTFLIPDQISLPLLWLGLFFSLFAVFVEPSQAIIGALVGYLSLWSIFQLFKIVTGKEGMGYGDFKLLAAGGAWLGVEMLLIVLILSSFSGMLVGFAQMIFAGKGNKIPFGPYLAAGIWLTMLFGDKMLTWYLPGL
ncbi:MAG: A24 family peptidase [Proteobacteria bacterium]|nr:A24 family peptidase [Pseudomonadota bacterium]